MKLGFHFGAGEDHLNERTVFEVDYERVAEGLFQIGTEACQWSAGMR
jgi:hypothetical protein